MTTLRVALDVPVDELFDYAPPASGVPRVGQLMVLPFGPRQVVGVVMETAGTSRVDPGRLRAATRTLDHLPDLATDVLELARFCHRYYHHPLGAAVHTALPTALRRAGSRGGGQGGGVCLTEAGRAVEPDGLPARAVVQRRLLAALRAGDSLTSAEVAACGATAGEALRVFRTRGWVRPAREDDRPTPAPVAAPVPLEAAPPLTPAQSAAVSAVAATLGRFACHLLHGVTGSGKTEVYLQLVTQVLATGGQALLLVPEINLTPQLEARVAARFGARHVVSLHSGLAEGERLQAWLRAVRGEAGIVLGTRLAVFTPLPRLGLVVVDEEHDPSYKQQEGLRYHARDLAVLRGRERGVPVVLGSATPSLETWRHAQAGRYAVQALPTRPGSPPPDIGFVDTRAGLPPDGLGEELAAAVALTLERGEQALLFLNRRGYAPTLYCHACGWVCPCPRCSSRLTVHLSARRLRCHYCGYQAPVTARCPSCGNQDLLPVGQGTQRLESALARRFPSARIARVDRDATSRRHAFEAVRERVAGGRVDLLVGTQMLAKGHDFPQLTLVGVLGADASLFAADFRAEERLFALLLQVAGRAGRGDRPGRVLVQTALPDHPLYRFLAQQDFAGFAAAQLDLRRRMNFPPWAHQALLRAEAAEEARVFDFLEAAAARARALPEARGVVVHDPAPAWVARVAGQWRGQLLLQGAHRPALQRLLGAWMPTLPRTRVRWSLDVDPVDG